jgi:hypothetical protein
VNDRPQRLAPGRVAGSGLLALTLLVATTTGCARVERAQDAGHEKAVRLEEERVLSDLQQQKRELGEILEALRREEQVLEEIQRREAEGESVPRQEREQAANEVRRLSVQLREEKQRHAQTLRKARGLGISNEAGP